MYQFNRLNKDPYHSDHIIVSPNVPVIRDENPPFPLITPWFLTVISAPAVNAGLVRTKQPGMCARLSNDNAYFRQCQLISITGIYFSAGEFVQDQIHHRMKNRLHRVLCAAYDHGVQRIVLGDFGCGALENHPGDVNTFLILLY